MLIEQSLINPNFIGRDSFRWFTGIVTKYKNTENGYRVKVRIIGHHPDDASIVKDEELPWAHVLVPLNFGAGEGGAGVSFNPRGSETVIGFFMDGDDGQQPVVIGALFSGSSIEHPNNFDKGTNGFKPFKPGDQIVNPANQPETGQAKPSGIPLATGRTPDNQKSKDQASKEQGTATVVQTVSACKSGTDTVSKIAQALRKLVFYLNTVQNYINIYVNPVLNYIQNIPQLISEVSQAIADGLSEWVKIIRDTVIDKIYKALKGLIERFLPKDLVLVKKLATDKIVDGIWCLFQNILKKLFKFVFDFLGQMFGKVVSIPLCAVESMIGSMMQTITNEINNAIGPAINELTSVLGQGIGQVSSIVSQAVSYARLALSFLECEGSKCKQEFDYEMNKGYVPKGTVNFQKILSYSPAQGVRNLFSDGSQQFSSWLGQNSGGAPSQSVLDSLGVTKEQFAAYASCDGTTLNCGLPKVTFFGGLFGDSGGKSASGVTVVDVLGQVLGVNLLDPGSGYSTAPYISFDDACNSGGGARGIAVTSPEDGSIKYVYVPSRGYDYLGPPDPGGSATGANSRCLVNPLGEDGFEYTAYIQDVIIINTGIGYLETDLIFNTLCDTGVEIYPITDPDGRIVDTNIVNPGTIRVFPELAINTSTGSGAGGRGGGSGAILLPVLGFVRVGEPSDAKKLAIKKKQKVILCADKK